MKLKLPTSRKRLPWMDKLRKKGMKRSKFKSEIMSRDTTDKLIKNTKDNSVTLNFMTNA